MSAQLPSRDEEILGRPAVDDLEAILTTANTDVDEVIHAVRDNADVIFTWDYEKGARPALDKLYEKAKGSQWNGQTDLPWELEVDQEKIATQLVSASVSRFQHLSSLPGSPIKHFGDISKEYERFSPDREWMPNVVLMAKSATRAG